LNENSDKILCCKKPDSEPEMVIELSKAHVSDQEVSDPMEFIITVDEGNAKKHFYFRAKR